MHDTVPDRKIMPPRLLQICRRYPSADPRMVADVARSVIEGLHGALSATETALLAELQDLSETITKAKAEIAAFGADDITSSQIPSATDELDAIVTHTAAATDAILEVCETLDEVATNLAGDGAAKLQAATTRIYEACSFQDITGQRISKVVATLKMIEDRVEHLLASFAPERATPQAEAASTDLLHGPQLPGQGMDQSDIDRLLASFE